MMPDLPNVDFERDVEQFIEFFENPAFRADGLKIYPTLVIRGTGLYELWKTGRYRSYPPSTLVDLIAKILALIPPWTRVYRYGCQNIKLPFNMFSLELRHYKPHKVLYDLKYWQIGKSYKQYSWKAS